MFDGADSPVTQSFGLGMLEMPDASSLELIERFFFDRGSAAIFEVSPMAGVAVVDLLCVRGYRPVEISNVMYRTIELPTGDDHPGVRARVIHPHEAQLWAEISARGWSNEYPAQMEMMREFGAIISAREDSPCFLAEVDGEPGAAGVLSIYEGVALFGGAATIPELRRRGLQTALLRERMRYAFEHGCDLAMMGAQAGSNSQRNAERQGFRIAYTRMKWRLAPV